VTATAPTPRDPRPGAQDPPRDADGFAALDLLATMVAVVGADGALVFANSAFEDALGLSRRALARTPAFEWFTEPERLRATIEAVARNAFQTSRLETHLKPSTNAQSEPRWVHVTVNRLDRVGDRVIVEATEIEPKVRQERDERTLEQVENSKELIRNLAHEIKNPLGGIRGAAQLLETEDDPRAFSDYTRVIIGEADRLQALVDRLLAPHRKPHVVATVNIHEVAERVRALIDAEFTRGLRTERDYDASLPEFQGDREQLIQAVLNIARNAAEALAERAATTGDARIVFRTRVSRHTTLGKQRWRLALELHVEDNGPGVPEPLRERIFFPLVSGRDGGSGLGLTLAQTFVQQHHGIVEFESEPGRTLFKVVIPIA
jgi:two-component system nitrogen regulation sensor histidine kinase GlnL